MTIHQSTDQDLDQSLIAEVADRIHAAYAQWLADPGEQYASWEADDAVPLRLIRHTLADLPPEYVDAALRQLDPEPGGLDLTAMDRPTDDDLAAAVWVGPGDGDWAHQLWLGAA